MNVTVIIVSCKALPYSYRLVSMTHFFLKVTPTNNTDYSCHIRAIEVV